MADESYDIQSVIFGDVWVEINFVDHNDVSKQVIDVRQRLIDPELIAEEIEIIKATLEMALDKAAIARRNPANSFTAPR